MNNLTYLNRLRQILIDLLHGPTKSNFSACQIGNNKIEVCIFGETKIFVVLKIGENFRKTKQVCISFKNSIDDKNSYGKQKNNIVSLNSDSLVIHHIVGGIRHQLISRFIVEYCQKYLPSVESVPITPMIFNKHNECGLFVAGNLSETYFDFTSKNFKMNLENEIDLQIEKLTLDFLNEG